MKCIQMALPEHLLQDKYSPGVQKKNPSMENTEPARVMTLTREANLGTLIVEVPDPHTNVSVEGGLGEWRPPEDL